MMYRLLTIICFVLILFSSCSKEQYEPVTISGTVIDEQQAIPVQNVTVKLKVQKLESGAYNANYSTLMALPTNKDGKFTFTFKASYYASYKLILEKDNYFDKEIEINPDLIVKGQDYNEDYYITPAAWLSVHILNLYSYDETDSFSYSLSGDLPLCMECCTGTMQTYEGMSIDNTSVCKVKGNSDISIIWTKTKNHITESGIATVFCAVFDTSSYDLSY